MLPLTWNRSPAARLLWLAALVALMIAGLAALPARAQDASPQGENPAPVTATVKVSTLNLRAGPGTSYAILDQTHAGDLLAVRGQTNGCRWLRVATAAGAEGWVSGDARYVTVGAPCAEIAAADPVAVTPAAPAPTVPAPAPTVPAPAPTVPAPAATVQPDRQIYGMPIPPGKGCIAFGNYAGPEVYVSGSHWETHEIVEAKLPRNEVTLVCFTPGRWGITVAAIANFWRDLSFDIDIHDGDAIDFPLVRG